MNAGHLLDGDEVVTETFAIGLLRGMLDIPSPSYREQELARYLADSMGALGFAAHVDRAGNAVGELVRGDGPTVLLLGHMDTVDGEVPVRCENGKLYGRGAVDAKGPLAAMICAAARAADFPGRLVVVGAVEEETPLSRGAMEVRRTLDRPDALVVGEPSGWSTVVLGYKGKLDLRYRVEVPPTQPSRPFDKAAELAARCWATLLDLLGPEADHGSFGRPGMTLTSVHGDLTEAEAEFSVRTPPGFDVDQLLDRLAARTDQGTLSVVNRTPACQVRRTDPVVRALSAGFRALGATPGAKLKTATSDMNILAERWAIPMATYGPGDSELDHADDEHIDLDDYVRGIAVLGRALAGLAGELATARHPAPRMRLVREEAP